MNIATIDEAGLRDAVRRAEKSRPWLAKYRWFAVFVLVPTFLGLIYYGLIASDVYTSQSKFVIKSPGQKSSQVTTLASLIQTTGISAGKDQTQEVLEYIRSRDALRDLNRKSDVVGIYSTRGADFLSKFPQPLHDRSFENLYKYYRTMVTASLDPESGMAVVEVRGFRPEDTHLLNARLLDLGEDFVNRLNERAERQAISEAERRVVNSEARLRGARLAMRTYRNSEDVLDPAKQAAGVLDVSNKLQIEYASLLAQLQSMQRATPRHPAIPALKNRVAATAQAIAAQNGRAVGSPTGLASKLGNYEKLALDQELATAGLTAANVSLEQARTESQKQQYYLERVVEPNTPDLALLPRRLSSILIIFATSLCLYFIGWMLVVGILEHAPED